MDVQRLPFDQYQRYRLVADVLGRLRRHKPGGGPLRVLDVGGRTAILREFLPKDRVELVDLEASDARDLVLGSGSALPFATESFDAVCAFDTLEHVPVEAREAFIDEGWRVAKHWLLLAGPYDTPRVRKAERLLDRFIRQKLGFTHRYLREHLDYGLPDRAVVEEQLRACGGEVLSVGHGNLERWLALLTLELYLDADPALRDMAPAIYGFYNRNLYASDHAEPVYRHLVVAAFGGAPLPDLDGLLDPPVAPKKTLPPFTELAQALAAFDAERGAWRDERAAFEERAAALEADLGGHRGLADELKAELERRDAVVADLTTDLEGHRGLRAELEGEREAFGARTTELERDLEGHRASLAEAREQLQGWERSVRELLEELEDHRARVVALEAERDGLALLRDNLAEDLEEHRLVLAELRGVVAGWEGTVAGLAEDLEGCRADAVSAGSQRDEALEVADDLRADLDGHRARLAELEGEHDALAEVRDATQTRLEEALGVVDELQADLDGHKARLAEVEAERDDLEEMHTAALADRDEALEVLGARETERDEALKVAEELSADLDGHKARLAEVEAERGDLSEVCEAALTERAEALEVVRDLEQDLQGHRELVASQEERLEEGRRLLEERDARIRELEAGLTASEAPEDRYQGQGQGDQ